MIDPPRPDDLPRTSIQPEDGYRLIGGDGGVFAFGHQTFEGSPVELALNAGVVGAAATPTGEGYWVASRDGGVFAFGDALYAGSAAGTSMNAPIVAVASTRSGQGYWLTSADGGVFGFGDAAFLGSLAGERLGSPIVDMVPTRTGKGYWMLGADGGVFSFGDAGYHGGLVDVGVTERAVGIAAAPDDAGYWVAGASGGVFAFGAAPYVGSVGDQPLNAPIVDIAATADGRGYWLVGRDGGVFALGDATWHGSLRKNLRAGIVAITAGMGWGPLAVPPPPDPVIVIPKPAAAPAPVTKPRRAATGPDGTGLVGNDISYPQCGREFPTGHAFGIVGVTGGRAFKRNPCLAEQWRWARSSGKAGVYVNVSFPHVEWEFAAAVSSPRQHDCAGEISCLAYNFGFNGVNDALAYARASGVKVPFVWLDIETMNYWTPNTEQNAVTIRGAIDAVHAAGLEVGVYSTDYQWRKIAGSFAPGLPVWIAGAPNLARAPEWCGRTFGGGQAVMVQTVPVRFDENLVCPGAGPIGRYFAP